MNCCGAQQPGICTDQQLKVQLLDPPLALQDSGGSVRVLDNDSIEDAQNGMLISIENHYLAGPQRMEPHTHHELEISCIPYGSGVYHIEGRDYDIRPGDVFILPNTDSHGLFLRDGEALNNLVIHFNSSFIWNSLANDMDYNFLLVFFEKGPHFSHRLDRGNPATARIYSLLQEIYTEFREQQEGFVLMIKIKLQTIFTEIIRHYDYVDRRKAHRPVPKEDVELLNTVMRYIDAHLDEEIRLAQLASIAHVSPAYFSTLFKRFNGLPPVEFIMRRRVQQAIELIRTTDQNMTAIAMACGFNNSTNFYKAFRKVTGRTPVSYRKAGDVDEDQKKVE